MCLIALQNRGGTAVSIRKGLVLNGLIRKGRTRLFSCANASSCVCESLHCPNLLLILTEAELSSLNILYKQPLFPIKRVWENSVHRLLGIHPNSLSPSLPPSQRQN